MSCLVNAVVPHLNSQASIRKLPLNDSSTVADLLIELMQG